MGVDAKNKDTRLTFLYVSNIIFFFFIITYNIFSPGWEALILFFYSEALNIDPLNRFVNSKLYFNRATVSAKQKKVEQSIADCSQAIDLDPAYTKAYLR